MVVKFQEVKAQRKKKGACPICGKIVYRSRTFSNTINPWNKDENGKIRTWDEVYKCVSQQADKWEPDFTHDKCQ